ncbi:hypothetical protein [Rubritalea tangerina]
MQQHSPSQKIYLLTPLSHCAPKGNLPQYQQSNGNLNNLHLSLKH